MMKYIHILLLILLGLSGCDDEETHQTTDQDCRDEEMRCPEGQQCQMSEDGDYTCTSSTAGEQMNGGESAGAEGGEEGGAFGGEITAGVSGSMAGGSSGGQMAGQMGSAVTPSGPLAVELNQLAIPFDDPTDPRTVSTVIGVRHGYAIDANTVILEFGPSLNVPEATFTEGYHIYSPDDDNYALELLTEPTGVELTESASSLPIPPDAQGNAYMRYEVSLTLPHQLQEGARYFVRAIGGQREPLDPEMHHRAPWTGYPLTGGRNAINFVFGEGGVDDTSVSEELIAQVIGLREITMVSPTHVRMLIGSSGVTALLDNPASFTIASEDDEGYGSGAQALAVGRRTYPEIFVPGYGYPFPRKLNRHEVYLELPSPLSSGASYTFSIAAEATPGQNTMTVLYTDDTTRNHHLKVNQLGYRPDSPVKLALIGAWMGTLGVAPYADMEGRRCVVVDDESGEEVFETVVSFRHDSTTEDEGAYRENFAREELYQCDFTDFEQPGRYFIKIEGVGRSYDFAIADDVYAEAFKTTMRGIFYQRSGQSLDAATSMYRRVASHLDPVAIPYMEDKPIVGGHYDAGDFNPRVKFKVLHILMLTYEMFPQKFFDGQLDIPENTNGVPDIMDEAEWGLQALVALQDEDGGVGFDDERSVFIESKSDPNFVEVAERDPWIQETYEKHPRGTLITAALMATASRIWGELGDADKAAMYLDVATRAYTWAKQNGASAHVDDYAWAAAEMARTTREASYLDDFRASGYALAGSFDDGNITRLRAAFSLALDTADEADFELSNLMYTNIRQVGDTLKRLSTYAYPHFQHPYAPVNWGTAAYPHTIETMVAMWAMSSNEGYLEMMMHSADFSLGVNPLNQSWTTGLGHNPIYGTCHLFAWHSFQGVIPPGLQSEGPNHDANYIERFMNENTPIPAQTPKYYNYYDVRYSIGLNEGVVKNQAWTAFLYGALLPDQPQGK